MLNIIKHKNIYFLISLIIIIPGLISLALFGLRLSIDFTGGSRVILHFPQTVTTQTASDVRNTFEKSGVEVATVQPSGNTLIVRSSPITKTQNEQIKKQLATEVGAFREESFETIGPTIGQETTWNAVKALAISTMLILFYLAWSFRKVPKPTSSWRFGITTVITLLHDVILLLGIFSLLGHFYDVEVDSLFVTALLTVMGFSVHDTIVVFDRIRENLLRGSSLNFASVVNDSIIQTMTRSLNTSITTLLVLFSLLLFGGESIRWFIVALFLGILLGTYSSIFNAAPLLVLWHELDLKWKARAKKSPNK